MQKSNKHPLAYFITIRAYGTWLPGDSRLTMDRVNNHYDTPKIASNSNLESRMHESLKCEPMHFNASKRDILKTSFINTCNQFNWKLYALHVRSNHAHVVLQSEHEPNDIVKMLKAKATHALREQGGITQVQKVWSRHGSTKYIWTECSLHYVCQYTIFEQGEKMAYVLNVR